MSKSATITGLVVAIAALGAGFFIYDSQSEPDISIDLPDIDIKKK